MSFCTILKLNFNIVKNNANTTLAVDILLGAGDGLSLLEVKSAQTVAAGAMRPTHKIADILGDQVKNISLVYGGEEYQKRSDFEVIPYRNMDSWLYPEND